MRLKGRMTPTEFEILAGTLRPRLLRQARGIVDADSAEDVVQDTMLRLWSMRTELDGYGSIEALAVVINRRLALSALRRSNAAALDGIDVMTEDLTPEEALIQSQQARYVDQVLSRLPDAQQTLLRLRHIEGYDNAPIAELLGSTEGAVRTALSRARRQVAAIFNIKER